MTRQLTPYEKNQLLKYGHPTDLPASTTPVEYLTGHADLAGHDFLVNPSVLIPRLETQELVDLALSHLKLPTVNSKLFIADLGTGSGAIGISLSLALLNQNIPHQLYLSDISDSALNLATTNASRLLPSTQQPILLNSDLFSDFPNLKFDLITANLPYIPTARIPTLDPSVRDHEPHLALDGGQDGTSIINRFLSQLPLFLASTGTAVLEIDHTHTNKSFPQVFSSILKAELLPDSFGQTRFLKISR